jgi:hypothetical protein
MVIYIYKFDKDNHLLNQYFELRKATFIKEYNSDDYPNKIESFDKHPGTLYFIDAEDDRLKAGAMLIINNSKINQRLPIEKYGFIEQVLPNINFTKDLSYSAGKGLVRQEDAGNVGYKVQLKILEFASKNTDILLATLDPQNIFMFLRSAQRFAKQSVIRKDLSVINKSDGQIRPYVITSFNEAISLAPPGLKNSGLVINAKDFNKQKLQNLQTENKG